MKNPTRRIRSTMGKIARGVAQVAEKAQRVAIFARESSGKREAREIFSRCFRQVILTVVELGISRLVRRITARPKPASVTQLPTLRLATS